MHKNLLISRAFSYFRLDCIQNVHAFAHVPSINYSKCHGVRKTKTCTQFPDNPTVLRFTFPHTHTVKYCVRVAKLNLTRIDISEE